MLVLGESGHCGFTAAKDSAYSGMKRELWSLVRVHLLLTPMLEKQ